MDKLKNYPIPYGKYIPNILDSIFELLKLCHDIYSKNKSLLTIDNDEIYLEAKKLVDKSTGVLYGLKNKDPHLTEGLFDRHRRESRYPRLGNLVIQSYLEARKSEEESHYIGILLPSPLYILYKYLTFPEHQESASYSLVSCRSLLFYLFGFIRNDKKEEVFDAISSFKRHIKIQMRWPKLEDIYFDKPFSHDRFSNQINLIVGHFFSLKGIANLWFRNETDITLFLDKSYSFRNKITKPNYHFRLSYKYKELPSNSEIINLMFGIPVPISGMEIIFFGGLRKAASEGLVVSISGSHGTGKTSLALSWAMALSPVYTKCLYITLEEGHKELKERLLSIEPTHFDDMSIYHRFSLLDSENIENKTDWFWTFTPEPNINGKYELKSFSDNILKYLQNSMDEYKKNDEGKITIIPNSCPSLIVIDNMNMLLEDNSKHEIVDFIHTCRKLNALVLIISGERIPEMYNIDYLADVTIELSNRQLEVFEEKPIRVFTLRKTRHQLARTGSHLFHLSGDKGFRISPQIPSQLDKRTPLRRNLPDEKCIINTLNLEKKLNHRITTSEIYYRNNLALFSGSNILIHGSGSSGKAGFGIKLLMTPPLEKGFIKLSKQKCSWGKMIEGKSFSNLKFKRKILVLSFLYPEEYYDELHITIQKTIKIAYPGISFHKPKVLAFYPGFLSAEDLINKITRELDTAYLMGEPYNGILLDGMHNVFLQFKKLQERDMIWPMLYNIFSRYDLTVVTTFTNFKIDENIFDFSIGPDTSLMQKGQVPFLHALVKATDFYIRLEEVTPLNKKTKMREKINIIYPKIAIKQDFEDFKLGWDKHKKNIFSVDNYDFDDDLTDEEDI